MARPKPKLTDEEVSRVYKLAGLGMPVPAIAATLDVSKATMERIINDDERVSEALEKGRADAGAKVANAAFNMAISGKHPVMTMFWLKCRQQWRESRPDQEDEETSDFNLNYKIG